MLFGSGGLLCWCPGGMRSIASSWSIKLAGTQDGKDSGTGESLVEMGCLLGCLLAWKKVNVEQVICIYQVRI